jgi:hypothetical protein
VAKERSQGILGVPGLVGLLLLSTALGYGAWAALTRPRQRPEQVAARRTAPANDSLGFVSVAGDGVDLEVVAPSGLRTATSAAFSTGSRIPGSDAQVDCPGITGPGTREATCTASIHLSSPSPGDYTVVVRSSSARAVVLNVGWATTSQQRRGGFDVPVQVARGGATAFTVIVTRDGVSQRTEPRPRSP